MGATLHPARRRGGATCPGDRWFVDETYVRVAGAWRYVDRAVDQHRQVIDVSVSKRRNLAAATRFFEALLAGRERPPEITTDLAAVESQGVVYDQVRA